jgi:hypothetical protein
MITIRATPRRSTPRIYEKALTARHPWVEGHAIRIGTSRVPAKDIPAYTKSLERLCEQCPLRIEDCPKGIVAAARKAYFAPLCRLRLPRLSTAVYDVLLETLVQGAPSQARGRFRTDSAEAVRRFAEKSVRKRMPASAFTDADLKAEVARLRIGNARLQQKVEILTAALKAKGE